MKKKALGVAILIIWVIFFIWELEVAKWIREMKGDIIRLDLIIIFPGLVLLTIYTLNHVFKK